MGLFHWFYGSDLENRWKPVGLVKMGQFDVGLTAGFEHQISNIVVSNVNFSHPTLGVPEIVSETINQSIGSFAGNTHNNMMIKSMVSCNISN